MGGSLYCGVKANPTEGAFRFEATQKGWFRGNWPISNKGTLTLGIPHVEKFAVISGEQLRNCQLPDSHFFLPPMELNVVLRNTVTK